MPSKTIESITMEYTVAALDNASNEDFNRALNLYNNFVHEEVRVASEEFEVIMTLKPDNIRIFYLGLYKDELLIGFMAAVYYEQGCFVSIDYICIDKAHRKAGTFEAFISLSYKYFDSTDIPIRFFVAEACFLNDASQQKFASYFTRLLKKNGFKAIEAPYYQPQVQRGDKTNLKAILMLLEKDSSVSRFCKEDYLEIVYDIYYDNYYKWNQSFYSSEELAEYKAQLDSCFRKIESLTDEIVDVI